jgi:hypothetical protein
LLGADPAHQLFVSLILVHFDLLSQSRDWFFDQLNCRPQIAFGMSDNH